MPTWVCDRDGWRHDGDWHHDSGDWCRDRWGGGWRDGDRGFYSGNSFWYGFEMGQLDRWNWEQPIYVVSPITGDPCGQLPAPDPNNGLGAQQQAYLDELTLMANPQQDPNNPDPTAGLYQLTQGFDPNNSGSNWNAPSAYNMLNSSQPVYFHPPNGDWEQLNQLGDLDAYLYTQEQRDQAPPQTVETPQNAQPDPGSDSSDTPPAEPTPAPQPQPAPSAEPQPEHWWNKVGDWLHNTF